MELEAQQPLDQAAIAEVTPKLREILSKECGIPSKKMRRRRRQRTSRRPRTRCESLSVLWFFELGAQARRTLCRAGPKKAKAG